MYGSPSASRSGSSLKKRLLDFAYRAGWLRLGRQLWARSLTVVNYHRIDDTQRPGFDSFKPNVSANPQDFERQMEYLAKWFHVISLQDLVQWLDGRKELPPYAALITFDDGYLDNYTTAYPILRRHNLPALIFLTTGHIGTDAPFYWDLAAYCFHHTQKDHMLFPAGKTVHWTHQSEREGAGKDWVEQLKSMPHREKQAWVDRLPGESGVSIPGGFFQNLMMNWEHIREMRHGGIEFGAHTVHHPILTRISLEDVYLEVHESKSKIETETGLPVLGFAYPNGQASDLTSAIEKIVAGSGIRAAFTLLNGPDSLAEVKRNPYAIRRIFISHRHSLPVFASLLHPLHRYEIM
jgi:peptidoglycan/xylan/chitin deacetylase (PgdA/CDA1 family)